MAMQSVPFVVVPQPSLAPRSQVAVAPSLRGSAGSAAFGVPGAAVGVVAVAAGARKAMKPRAARKAQSEKRFPVLSRSDPPLGTFPKMPESVHPGVVSGQALVDLLNHAKENGYAIPAVNCVSSSSINACIEAARKMDAPVMIQFSSGGSQFYAGKGLDNTEFHAAIAGAVSGAYHVRAVAEQYGVPVILHTDHCAKNLLPWFDGLLEADERYFELHGEPLFSSHMLDLSEEPLEENIEICVKYLERMAKINCGLEMELGITGGEEDGVNNEDANPEDLYSKPEEIFQVYDALSKIPNGFFTVAAAFGNVHGVYQPGNVKLEPTILDKAQKYISEKIGAAEGSKPVSFRTQQDIREAVDYGVRKLRKQIGNPEGEEKPNKKYYDPRACIRSAEESTVKRTLGAEGGVKNGRVFLVVGLREQKHV
ncbi:unnamed protein product [Cladocopium goreaui]|uniref:fructose-bisphosphate aldolase n=1 Tax=Cladocopium goreaui TaxID=2562237 RepID=A0A9P1C2J8_9DINO|nr:unnamed protein product [Cladocopium goreaui]